jgi:hypothetical protein
MRLSLDKIRLGAVSFARRQVSREAFSTLFHVLILFALVSLVRSWFFRGVGDAHYKAASAFMSMASSDIDMIVRGAKRHSPVVPEILVFLLPVVIFFASKRKLRWTDWEHGKALRVFAMLVILMLCWSGGTSPYNAYIGRTHGLDRLILAGSALLSWRYPIFVPLAVRMAIVMLRESYVPILIDDFDFRAPAEVAVVFAVFVMASFSKSFKPAHFLIVGVGSFAAYYYSAGMAKHNFGPPGSWLNENHVSNISVASHVRGWLAIVPDSAFMKFAGLAEKLDYPLQLYTLIIELGSIVFVFLDRRVMRYWFLGAFVLNFGIFMMTGICFWKWMVVSLGMFVWGGRSGKPLLHRMFEYKLPLLLGIASIYWSNHRIWYYPQTHVVWYDTRFMENYEFYAIGVSGQRYFVRSTSIEPQESHWTQGRLCNVTNNERQLTGIYATVGGYSTMKTLQKATPEAAFKMQARSRICRDPKAQAKFDDFMKHYFGNLNRSGRKLRWLRWIQRPNHLWVQPRGDLNGGDNILYERQEKIAKIELWLTSAYNYQGELHRTEPKLTHTVDIPH